MLWLFPLCTDSAAGLQPISPSLQWFKSLLCFGLSLKCPLLAQFVTLGPHQMAMLRHTVVPLGSVRCVYWELEEGVTGLGL